MKSEVHNFHQPNYSLKIETWLDFQVKAKTALSFLAVLHKHKCGCTAKFWVEVLKSRDSF